LETSTPFNQFGNTPLAIAIGHGKTFVATVLRAAGATK